jgi:hypothetical protein
MRKTNLLIALTVALQMLPSSGICAEPAPRHFVAREYPTDQFKISATEIKRGNLKVKIKQAKRTKNFEQTPHSCRVWLDVGKSTKPVFSRYYDDIDPVGFSYGLFIPTAQPELPYLAIVKNGDYNGRLFLFGKDGKVNDLLGGLYFLTKDKRYLFSEYASDASGLAVFDLVAGIVVFSSEQLPHIYQWYERNGNYFFTEAEWKDNSGRATEKAGTVHTFDIKQQKLIEKKVKPAFIKKAKVVKWDFDPREYEDCTSTPNTPVEPSR